MLKILAIFIAIPFIELYIIVEIGKRLGFWPTLAMIVIPGLIGAAMARSQGTAVFSEIKREIAAGRLPATRILDGILIFCGGLLLITPGVITDIAGLTVLFPGARRLYRELVISWIRRLVTGRAVRFYFKKPL